MRKNVVAINICLTLICIIAPAIAVDIGKEYIDDLRWNKKMAKRVTGEKGKELRRVFRALEYEYKPFTGWRASDIRSSHVNISKGERFVAAADTTTSGYWMFGGSTMFGILVRDDEAVPAVVGKEMGVSTRNLGMSGWNSRQSLNLLLGELIGKKPKGVVFMDGVNEVLHGCRKEIGDVPSHSLEKSMRIISAPRQRRRLLLGLTASYLLGPVRYIQSKWTAVGDLYVCDTDKDRAVNVARNLVQSWRTAYDALDRDGVKALFILQPTLYDSSIADTTDARLDEVMRRQYATVYSMIERELEYECKRSRGFCNSVRNGRKVMVGYSEEYIDDNHLTANGNSVLGKWIAKELKGIMENEI